MMLDLDKFKAVKRHALDIPPAINCWSRWGGACNPPFGKTDVLARLGGDEFAIIQEGGPNQHEGAIALALRIINAISKPLISMARRAGVAPASALRSRRENGCRTRGTPQECRPCAL